MLSIWISKIPYAQEIGLVLKEHRPTMEKCIIAGPTFVGFALGILKYQPGEKHFEIGFQSLCIFCAYIVFLVAGQILDSLFFSSWPLILGIWRSCGALAYLVLTLKQCKEWLSGDVVIYRQVAQMRGRVQEFIGNAG